MFQNTMIGKLYIHLGTYRISTHLFR